MKVWAKNKQVHSGFTIVELLIVVVVIAILAAITIVSYNGITEQARRAQLLSGVNVYIKALKAYKADNGSYPSLNGCLGADYSSNACWFVGSTPSNTVSTTLDTALARYISVKPVVETRVFPIGIASYNRGGLLYLYNDSTYGNRLVWYFQGIDKDCGIKGAQRINEGGIVSQCNLSLD